MANFIPLNALKTAVQACKNDLAKLRGINTTLTAKITALASRTEYSARFITEETGKLRETAMLSARQYLEQQESAVRFQNIAAQREHWTVARYLARAQSAPDMGLEKYDTNGNTNKLLQALLSEQRLTNLLLSFGRLSDASLAEQADAALAAGDWPKLGALYTEARFRTTDEGVRLAFRLAAVEIPDCTQAAGLIDEARQYEEFISHTSQSIATGDRDLGQVMEGYAKTAQERQQAAA